MQLAKTMPFGKAGLPSGQILMTAYATLFQILVFSGRFLSVIHHQEIHGAFLGFHAQAELVLQSLLQRRTAGTDFGSPAPRPGVEAEARKVTEHATRLKTGGPLS